MDVARSSCVTRSVVCCAAEPSPGQIRILRFGKGCRHLGYRQVAFAAQASVRIAVLCDSPGLVDVRTCRLKVPLGFVPDGFAIEGCRQMTHQLSAEGPAVDAVLPPLPVVF